ncbi:EAL and HDOD domain-containing protein [Thiomicrorhabdus cannonii]|uniref:EAL and HDOD domain-containing protein n=1 Tax=Thiomicrorhabdus cannonii TaxID=2748011 RepID=UPI0015B828BE|nr:HDOD domain-containing protein [Thiomicrorhabdus cannonii]
MQHHLLFNKQPVLDAAQTLFAYQLSVVPIQGKSLTEAQWAEEIQDLWKGIEENIGFDNLTAGKPVFYQAPLQALKLELLPAIRPMSHLVVEVDIDLLRDRQALANVKEMLKVGVQIAVKNYTRSDAHDKLLSIAKLVKINAADLEGDALSELLSSLHEKNLKVVLTGVDTEEVYESLKQNGAAYFQGYFFTNPIVSTQQQIASQKLAMLNLLAQVNDPDVSFEELAATIGTDVGLSHKLLSAINHPANQLPHVIESLKEAVSFMGLKRLKFWVNMLMMSEVDDVPVELLATALVRAKFLENVAEKIGLANEKDRYFTVGLFSTLNAFLRAPMVDIVDQLPLSDEVKQALVNQVGPMGKALFITRALEQGNTHLLMAGIDGMDIMAISSGYLDANGWARNTLSSLKEAA